jgi:hypothetical protein
LVRLACWLGVLLSAVVLSTAVAIAAALRRQRVGGSPDSAPDAASTAAERDARFRASLARRATASREPLRQQLTRERLLRGLTVASAAAATVVFAVWFGRSLGGGQPWTASLVLLTWCVLSLTMVVWSAWRASVSIDVLRQLLGAEPTT